MVVFLWDFFRISIWQRCFSIWKDTHESDGQAHVTSTGPISIASCLFTGGCVIARIFVYYYVKRSWDIPDIPVTACDMIKSAIL